MDDWDQWMHNPELIEERMPFVTVVLLWLSQYLSD